MPGGDREAYDRIAPFLDQDGRAGRRARRAARSSARSGAGHYVKMVHNGIEYADMQLIAEAYDLLKIRLRPDGGGDRRRLRGVERRATSIPT